MRREFWPFQSLVTPSVPTPTPAFASRRRFLTGPDALAALRLILADSDVADLIHSIHIGPNEPLSILCAVPRASDDPSDDVERVRAALDAAVLPIAV